MGIASSELVLTSEGKVYHLDLTQNEISHKIILVGDQNRVALISQHFDTIEVRSQKREFVCHTGTYKGKRLSVISTGIGTDNIDIVLNELDALVNIDLKNRTVKEKLTSLEFIRIGTCGVLQADISVGSFVLTTGAIGMDNVAHFYEFQQSENEKSYTQALYKELNFSSTIQPYYVDASPKMIEQLDHHSNIVKGITVTATGFYGPQGRKLRIPLKQEKLNDQLAQFSFDNSQIVNLEMETSAILALSKMMGHEATSICLAIANRPTGTFLSDYSKQMDELILYVLGKF